MHQQIGQSREVKHGVVCVFSDKFDSLDLHDNNLRALPFTLAQLHDLEEYEFVLFSYSLVFY